MRKTIPSLFVAVLTLTGGFAGGSVSAQTCQGDFVTGGGLIQVGSNIATFGFNAGFKPNASGPEIHLFYIDHGIGMDVKAITISVYVVGDTPTSRHMEGSAEIDDTPVNYSIDVTDNDQPGRGHDTFRISLSNGYSAGGILAGGNIKLHNKPCPPRP